MSLPSFPPLVYFAPLASFAVALLPVLTKRWHGRFSMGCLRGQKVHLSSTPRIGGVGAWLQQRQPLQACELGPALTV